MRSKSLKLFRRQRGDTIIEVLIAIAIVSLVLASAYAVTIRNSKVAQQVQEQAYAQKLVEQQVELLRSTAPAPAADGCFDNTTLLFVSVAASCKVVNGGATYNLWITHAAQTYTAKATWETTSGQNANVTVYYEVQS